MPLAIIIIDSGRDFRFNIYPPTRDWIVINNNVATYSLFLADHMQSLIWNLKKLKTNGSHCWELARPGDLAFHVTANVNAWASATGAAALEEKMRGEKKEREKSERGHHGGGARGAHHRFFSYVRRVVRVTGVMWNAVLAPHPTSLSYTKAGPPLVVAPSVVEHVSTTHPSILGSDLMRHWIGFSPVFHLLQRCTLQPFVNISCNHK